MRRRSTGSELAGRIETSVVLGFAAAMTAFWVLGEQSSARSLGADSAMRSPVIGGTPALVIIVVVMLLNAWFVAAETAVGLLKNLHVKQVKEPDSLKSRHLQALLDSRQKYVAACALGSQTSRLTLALLSFLLAPGLADFMEGSFGWRFGYLTILLGTAVIALLVGLVNMVIGELVPKSFAALHPHRVALASYRFIRITSVIFSVPANIVVALAGVFTARFGGQARLANVNQAEEEIKNIVESAEESGEIEKDEKELLHSVFSFTDKVAREVMTPRVDIDAVPIETEPAELVKLIEDSGHSRIPLFEGTDDQILGIVHAKDLLMAMVEDESTVNVRKLMRPALFVPENKDLHELLKEMRQGRVQMAVVQDEFGGTAGIVTVEDIVEELVGDITDEYDVETPEVEQVGSGFEALGKAHLDDVNQHAGSSFGSEEFDTIGGYVFGLFGRQPKLFESISHEGWKLTVIESDGRRILRVRIEVSEEPESDGQTE
ncbi:MAG: hemolysin family protein [Fimbriimonas sp.]|nr:hemolysin family protein [Fimbriimonas sp.]